MKRKACLFLVFLSFLTASGCATGRNYQTDIDALNAKLAALQGQLSTKDEEVTRLQNQLKEATAAGSHASSKHASEPPSDLK
ncbi:MAG: hypothetical protein HYZ52_05070 [Candidatus Omnitrophica bacterium]|nr:hypothetical protein [Candidatus Omnitrophota bacterium]